MLRSASESKEESSSSESLSTWREEAAVARERELVAAAADEPEELTLRLASVESGGCNCCDEAEGEEELLPPRGEGECARAADADEDDAAVE